MLGEHTNKVLGELGFTGPEIERLLESNAAVSTNSLLKRMGQAGKAKAFRPNELLQEGDTYAEQAAQRPPVPEPSTGTADGPLTGVKVLELTTGVTGPIAALMLAGTGADVIKVERKFDVDPTRRAGTGPLYFGATFVALNRDKRAVALDPNAAAGSKSAKMVEGLPDWADVVLVDAASEAAFKVSAASATASRPRLLYTKIASGPGEYELQAWTGPAGNQIHHSDAKPHCLFNLSAEKSNGMYVSIAVIAALSERLRSGKGQVLTLDPVRMAVHYVSIDMHMNWQGGSWDAAALGGPVGGGGGEAGGERERDRPVEEPHHHHVHGRQVRAHAGGVGPGVEGACRRDLG